MTKAAYLIVLTDIHDPETFAKYGEVVTPLVAEAGGRVLAATGDFVVEDGEWSRGRLALIRFGSLPDAERFYHSDAYAPLKTLRESASSADLILAESPLDLADDGAEQGLEPYYLLGAATAAESSWVPEYMEKVPPISARFGVKGLAMGNDFTTLEGEWPGESLVLLEFRSQPVFRDFWYGEEYRPMKELREAHSTGPHISFPSVVN